MLMLVLLDGAFYRVSTFGSRRKVAFFYILISRHEAEERGVVDGIRGLEGLHLNCTYSCI